MSTVDRIRKWQAAVDALTLRERLMLFVGALVVIGGFWEALLASPLQAREARASNQIESLQERLEQLDEAMTLAAAGIGDGLSGQADRILALERQIAANEETVRVFTSDLVNPAEMRYVLEELIDRQRGLELSRASNLEVRPLLERDTGDESETDESMLYRHGLLLEFEGSYLDCLAYIEAVERLPWRIYWGSLHLRTDEFPRNRITLELFTLSLDKDWIGV